MSALTEKVAQEHHHWAGLGECRCGALIPEVGCGDNRDLYAEHIAYITEAATRAAVLAEFEQHDERHWCTKACPDGCDVAVTRVWTRREVIERREPLTDKDIAALRDRFPDIFRRKGQP